MILWTAAQASEQTGQDPLGNIDLTIYTDNTDINGWNEYVRSNIGSSGRWRVHEFATRDHRPLRREADDRCRGRGKAAR
ncbi:hypothetical protein PRECH8_12650 [Insulibacter thermoxylanivorax]|uniref:Uncharacterized protein n=1 Tax=Insulibacter thermoxylanivorax TaxID=2749268 RepID=A0A916VFS5_9BACL|nr:hypothetical protein PRECH8_12650 [Insulibacter thermoxylanivorax]